MRNLFFTAVVLALGAHAQAAPFPGTMVDTSSTGSGINQQGAFGAGVMLGEPMGATVKFWANDFVAVDAGLGWSFPDPDGVQIHTDALFHRFDPFRSGIPDLAFYVGAGLRLKFPEHGDTHVGIRAPFGAAYMIPEHNLEFYAEVAPILDLTPSVRVAWNGGVGIRYHFK